MALINKPDYSEIWASGGSIVEPSDVKKQTGWTAEVPPYQWENWIQNRQDQMLAHINQRGIVAWSADTDYEAGGLSYVQGSDGEIYRSVASSGPSATVQDPVTDVSGTYWAKFVRFGTTAGTYTEGNDPRITGAAQKAANLSDLASASAARQNLGLGTAATRDVTVSNTDTTVGRLLKVGDFGLGTVGEMPNIPATDLNDLIINGVFNVGGDTPNWPYGGSGGVVQQFMYNQNQYITQIAYSSNSDTIKTRTKTSPSSWTSWVDLLHTGSILTTTGQSTSFPMTQKAVTDELNDKVSLTGNQTIAGIKTFSSFPVTPSAAPTANYQTANKKYVDDNSIGVGQTWQDVTASRVLGTTYTNTTGRAILVNANITAYDGGAKMTVDGIDVAEQGQVGGTGSDRHFISAIVPAGSTYSVQRLTGIGEVSTWAELR